MKRGLLIIALLVSLFGLWKLFQGTSSPAPDPQVPSAAATTETQESPPSSTAPTSTPAQTAVVTSSSNTAVAPTITAATAENENHPTETPTLEKIDPKLR
jgi:cytoskeletal protein RodZ